MPGIKLNWPTENLNIPISSTLRFISLYFTSLPFLPDLFDNYMQQDAHEFLNYLLNTVADILQEEKKQEKQNGRLKNNGTAVTTEAETENKTEPTWVHDIFQGTLTNETRCLNCETVCVALLPSVYFMSLCHPE